MENITIPVDLLRNLAPEASIDQDEQGGCVWCGLNSGPVAEGHANDCPWLAARRLLTTAGEPATLRAAYPNDPALLRLIATFGDDSLTALANPKVRSERARRILYRREFNIIETGPDLCAAVVVTERPYMRTDMVTISYLGVDPQYRNLGFAARLVAAVVAGAKHRGLAGVTVAPDVALATGRGFWAAVGFSENEAGQSVLELPILQGTK